MEELASCLESLWVKTHFALQPFSAVTLSVTKGKIM